MNFFKKLLRKKSVNVVNRDLKIVFNGPISAKGATIGSNTNVDLSPDGSVTINDVTYKGKNVRVENGNVFIDGKEIIF